jgi:hypothetical protein
MVRLADGSYLSPQEAGRLFMERPDFNAGIKRDADKRMQFVDSLPKPIRELVHEYGVAPVVAIYQAGVRKPQQFHNIIAAVRGEWSDGRPATRPNARGRNPLETPWQKKGQP